MTSCNDLAEKQKTIIPVSPLRKRYIARLVGRCIILMVCIVLYITASSEFDVLNGMQFFHKFSLLHILWGIWLIDMICQLIPIKTHIPLGSQKLFRQRFRPIRGKINYESLKKHVVSTTRSAYRVMILWAGLVAAIGVLYYFQIIDKRILFLISVVFYVCDLICVLIWCPFRLIMKNKCCTTCRIFNWDHLMMFSPYIYMGGFFAWSLLGLAILVWLVWEISIMIFPERFWEMSNDALKCSNCMDKLCTQYCRKLR